MATGCQSNQATPPVLANRHLPCHTSVAEYMDPVNTIHTYFFFVHMFDLFMAEVLLQIFVGRSEEVDQVGLFVFSHCCILCFNKDIYLITKVSVLCLHLENQITIWGGGKAFKKLRLQFPKLLNYM